MSITARVLQNGNGVYALLFGDQSALCYQH